MTILLITVCGVDASITIIIITCCSTEEGFHNISKRDDGPLNWACTSTQMQGEHEECVREYLYPFSVLQLIYMQPFFESMRRFLPSIITNFSTALRHTPINHNSPEHIVGHAQRIKMHPSDIPAGHQFTNPWPWGSAGAPVLVTT
ncbi:hypothetical protein EDB84DRAFT_1439428 [Lactarius hengduanensis]|nr:hypothetical protein EDB84DRAFT_1439428 [Lactarius hengduanensis]